MKGHSVRDHDERRADCDLPGHWSRTRYMQRPPGDVRNETVTHHFRSEALLPSLCNTKMLRFRHKLVEDSYRWGPA